MSKNLVAMTEIHIDAPESVVWNALLDPAQIEKYMFGAKVESDWKEGSPIVWHGEWKGKAYDDRGTILKKEERRRLQYDHYSPLSGAPDLPEHHHTVTIELEPHRDGCDVLLTQDNNLTEDARRDSEQNWTMMLESLKRVVEGTA